MAGGSISSPATLEQSRSLEYSVLPRRTANYKPNEWDYAYLQTLKSEYTEEAYGPLSEKLKEEVRLLLDGMELLPQLQLVDAIRRLGMDYHFEEEIKRILDERFARGYHKVVQHGLHATATCFRLLREHGYTISEDIFNEFKDHKGSFRENLSNDVKGLLSLYHASYLAFDGETTLDAARVFAVRHLKEVMELDPVEEVARAMELPVHWRMPRVEARLQIEVYDREEGMDPTLLRLAKLDYNMVQAMHRGELMKTTSWWMSLGLHEEVGFSRERIWECFFGAAGIVSNPLHGFCREGLGKAGALLVLIDDVYDVYGSLDELELFTQVVDRWEIKAIEKLPRYLKLCFTALHGTVNEIAYEVQRYNGWQIQAYLKKSWADLCKSFLVEARWHNDRYMPTLKEYLDNGWISVSGPLILFHVYLLLRHEPTEEALRCLENYPDIVRSSSTIFRLCNDLATSRAEQERGDTPTSIQCHMNESGVSEASAREQISSLISTTWKELNRECISCSLFPSAFIDATMNLARMAHCFYQHGDGFGIQNAEIKGHIKSMLLKPVS